MRTWTWHKGSLWVDGELVCDFEDFWEKHLDAETEILAQFIVDACNAAEQSADEYGSGRNDCFEDPLNNDMRAVDSVSMHPAHNFPV